MGHDQRPPRAAWCSPSRTPASSSPRSWSSTLAEPFQRGTERIRTDHAGVGLGLAIVKSIAQAHDGTLTLTPRAAGGLRVTVQLPAAPPHTGQMTATEPAYAPRTLTATEWAAGRLVVSR